jgi:hypothetical protein
MRLALALLLALVVATLAPGLALADTYAVNTTAFPLPTTNQLFPARSNRMSLKCVNPSSNAAVTIGYASGFSFVMAPGATLWEISRVPQGKITATGTAGQIIPCEEMYL